MDKQRIIDMIKQSWNDEHLNKYIDELLIEQAEEIFRDFFVMKDSGTSWEAHSISDSGDEFTYTWKKDKFNELKEKFLKNKEKVK